MNIKLEWNIPNREMIKSEAVFKDEAIFGITGRRRGHDVILYVLRT